MKNIIKTLTFIFSIFLIYSCSSNNKFYTVVEQMPSYPGGEAAMNKFIHENLRYSAIGEEYAIQSRIVLRFVISKKGKIKDIEKVKDMGNPLADSLIKVVKMMPDWNPGKQNGKAVDVYYTLPMLIHLR